MTLEDQPTLFDVETPPVRVPKRQSTVPGKPKWSAYKTQRGMKCDDCMTILCEAKGEGPASRPARWRRIQGELDLLLCYAHAAARRAEDGLDELEVSA
jgi:hypothetical protein